MEIKIEILNRENLQGFRELLEIYGTVFEMKDFKMPEDEYLNNLLQKPDFFCIVAKHNEKIIGGLTIYILHSYYVSQPAAYIYDAGVLPDYQRQGAGSKMIEYLISYCGEKGFSEIFVQAETEDEHAVRFYRSALMDTELSVKQFAYRLQP